MRKERNDFDILRMRGMARDALALRLPHAALARKACRTLRPLHRGKQGAAFVPDSFDKVPDRIRGHTFFAMLDGGDKQVHRDGPDAHRVLKHPRKPGGLV
jgi:hypothetical protein